MKQSCCLFPDAELDLNEAEESMLGALMPHCLHGKELDESVFKMYINRKAVKYCVYVLFQGKSLRRNHFLLYRNTAYWLLCMLFASKNIKHADNCCPPTEHSLSKDCKEQIIRDL